MRRASGSFDQGPTFHLPAGDGDATVEVYADGTAVVVVVGGGGGRAIEMQRVQTVRDQPIAASLAPGPAAGASAGTAGAAAGRASRMGGDELARMTTVSDAKQAVAPLPEEQDGPLVRRFGLLAELGLFGSVTLLSYIAIIIYWGCFTSIWYRVLATPLFVEGAHVLAASQVARVRSGGAGCFRISGRRPDHRGTVSFAAIESVTAHAFLLLRRTCCCRCCSSGRISRRSSRGTRSGSASCCPPSCCSCSSTK